MSNFCFDCSYFELEDPIRKIGTCMYRGVFTAGTPACEHFCERVPITSSEKALEKALENMHIEVNIGRGEIKMEPVEFEDGIPTIVIHKLKKPQKYHSKIPKDAEYTGVPIQLKFHSMGAIVDMYRMLAPLMCEWHMREIGGENNVRESDTGND